jgi:hypothetical protein
MSPAGMWSTPGPVRLVAACALGVTGSQSWFAAGRDCPDFSASIAGGGMVFFLGF